jgi:hypothetical protein
MKPFFRTLLFATVCTFLTGCFQIERVVSVKPDGSGTLTETIIIPKAMLAQMKEMTEGFAKSFGDAAGPGGAAAPAPAPKSPADPDEAKLREQASKMGEGVTFVSAKKVATANGEGYAATYAFTDINKLKLNQDLSDSVPGGSPGIDVQESKPEIIAFQFTKAKPSQLTITMPVATSAEQEEKKDEAKPDESFPGGEEMAMTMMKEMFKDMRVTLAVEVVGKLVKTDAENVAGNRVTLMDMDFNKLLANPEKFKAMSKANPKSFEEAKKVMKGIDGIKFETKQKVAISFQ